jgi:hypothetical protein
VRTITYLLTEAGLLTESTNIILDDESVTNIARKGRELLLEGKIDEFEDLMCDSSEVNSLSNIQNRMLMETRLDSKSIRNVFQELWYIEMDRVPDRPGAIPSERIDKWY